MRRIKLTIAYDGTDFHGWQIQTNKPTIQGEIVGVLRRLTQENVVLHAAGRTDAGVHALGQVGSFRTQSPLSAQEFQRALNALLPPAIRIAGAEEVGPDFNARWSAQGKTYGYRLYRGKVVPPMVWRYVLHYPFPLDEDAMRAAAAKRAIFFLVAGNGQLDQRLRFDFEVDLPAAPIDQRTGSNDAGTGLFHDANGFQRRAACRPHVFNDENMLVWSQ